MFGKIRRASIAQSLPDLQRPGVFSSMNRRTKRKLTRYGIIAGNIALLLGVALFIVTNRYASQTVRSSTVSSLTSTSSSTVNPLDQLSSAQIAYNVAQMANMPEIKSVKNQADSDSILLSIVPNDTTVLAKPQIVATTAKSKKDIVNYVAQSGDTVASLSNKFGVSAESIRASNNLSGDSLNPGTKLVIPPFNGIVYIVKSGDTPQSLASKYQSDPNQIIAVNDAEVGGIKPGEQIVIPGGHLAAAPVTTRLTYGSFLATYGGNGYDFGYCTWYVANRVSVPTNWGNANTWAIYASLSGWTVSTVPVKGAIAQSSAMSYLGHVAYVEDVSADHSMIKYSDMNGLQGWGRVGYSDWVPASTFQHYLYH